MKEKITSAIQVIVMLGICMVGITLMYMYEGKSSPPNKSITTSDNITLRPKFMDQTPKEGLRDALEYYGIHHPDIVYAQAILETGHFKSVGCLKHNNLFGLYNSRAKRYHRFEHWTESVVAYKKWIQRRYKPPADYYTFLKRIGYATDPQYIQKLKIIVKKENDKRRYAEGDTFPQRV